MQTGSGDKILDWGVVIAAGILFFKTADILSYFSPGILNDIAGLDVSLIYGIVCALLVEGLALALHFNHRARYSGTAQTVKWVLLAISGACQVFDGFVVTDTLSGQTDTMKAFLSYGVPLIPLLIMVMVFGIGRLPDPDGTEPVKQQFVGVLPTVKRIWYGDKPVSSPAKPTTNALPAPPAKQPVSSPQMAATNALELPAVSLKVNPTNGKNGKK